jgi:hypothetical protein
MDAAEALKKAWSAVEESGVPETMHEAAFKEVLRSLLGAAPAARPASGASDRPAAKPPRPGAETADPEDGPEESAVIAAVASETGVPADKLERLFHIDEGVVKLIPGQGSLGSSTAEKARAIAQVVTVVRAVGMSEPSTAYDAVRDECKRKHCYDGKNFASLHMGTVPGFVTKGDGGSRRLEMKGGGLASFPALVDKILGES